MPAFVLNATAPTEIYTLSLHDALPILDEAAQGGYAVGASDVDNLESSQAVLEAARAPRRSSSRRPAKPGPTPATDRKSTRLNSSHTVISYAVFCLKKKKNDTRG